MGIHGLWQVLEPTGRPINIHSLRGKVLAIDVSIWLHQLVKGFRDKDGNPLPNAHLLGVFHRVCKLLNDGIRPVFVFDGGVPVLKRQTLASRRQRKIESLDKAELSRQKILSAFLRQQLQRQAKVALPPSMRMQAQIDALSSGAKKSPSVSPKKQRIPVPSSSRAEGASSQDDKIDEDLEAFSAALIAKLEDDMEEESKKDQSLLSDDEMSPDDGGYQYGVDYSENFSMIQTPDFDTLPLETQHEILFEMQESRKMNSWGKFDKMPKDLQSFSSFQMDRLVKRRTLQKKIQSVQQEMGQRHIHVQNLDDLLKMDYNDFEDKETKITGSKDDGFVLIKSQSTPTKKEKEDPKPGTSSSSSGKAQPEIITIDDFIEESSSDGESMTDVKGNFVNVSQKPKFAQKKAKGTPSDDEDADLKLAIELSLKESVCCSETTYNDSKEETKVSSSLTSTKKSQDEEVSSKFKLLKDSVNLKHQTQESSSKAESTLKEYEVSLQPSQVSHCAKFLDTVGFNVPHSQSKSTVESDSKHLKNSVAFVSSSKAQSESSTINKDEKSEGSTSESDDDFEEVEDAEKPLPLLLPMASSSIMGRSETVATIDLTAIGKLAPDEEDIFADIFSEKTTEHEQENNTCTSTSDNVQVPSKKENILNGDADTSSISNSNKVSEQVKWDSDSEIEADLLEMVMRESTTSSAKPKPKEIEADPVISHLPSKEPSPKSDDEIEAAQKNDQAVEDKRGPVRMITADYMQAQEKLNTELGQLHSEMGNQERIATSISDQMQIETQELISLFGIPYIISPTEAESQCAFLDRACLTEGTITDDSDVWLFGGQRVYKNFFSQGQRHIELYQAADIQRVLNLNREKLIVLAIMIGSDYSDGIQGVGPVLGLEILSEFSSANEDSFEILVKFRDWWEEIQTKSADVFSGSKLKEKLRKLKLRPGFPSKAVYDAFIDPAIDQSTEPFKWGNPDLDAIRSYTKQKFGWEQTKCDSLLLPVLKKRQCELDQSRQLTLDSYISFGKMPSLNDGKRKKGSKRIQAAVKRLKRVGMESHELNLSSESDSDEEIKRTRNETTSGKQATTSRRNKTNNNFLPKEKVQKRKKPEPVDPTEADSTTQTTSSNITATLNRLTPKKTPEIIPQRVQAETDKMKNKQKAIEVFKKRKVKP